MHSVKICPPDGVLKQESFKSYSWYIPRAAEVWESEREKVNGKSKREITFRQKHSLCTASALRHNVGLLGFPFRGITNVLGALLP